MIQKLRSHLLLGTVIVSALFGTLSSQAVPTVLYHGSESGVTSPGPIIGGTAVAGGTLLTPFSVSGMSGQLGVKILSGVAANPYSAFGGLTFVYELANLNVDPDTDGDPLNDGDAEAGALTWVVGPFAQYTTSFELGDSFYFQPAGSVSVMPEVVKMDSFGLVTVTYPPNEGAPPIFGNENTFQMIFHTNATDWVTTTTGMEMYMDDLSTPSWSTTGPVWTVGGIATYTPLMAVPDGGATLLPLALALLALHRFQRRRG